MLLYHRPVPAKIPKRRSRAGKQILSGMSLRQLARTILIVVVVVPVHRLRSLVSFICWKVEKKVSLVMMQQQGKEKEM